MYTNFLKKYLQKNLNQEWWHTSVIPATGEEGEGGGS
jgi:hypothetical protein